MPAKQVCIAAKSNFKRVSNVIVIKRVSSKKNKSEINTYKKNIFLTNQTDIFAKIPC